MDLELANHLDQSRLASTIQNFGFSDSKNTKSFWDPKNVTTSTVGSKNSMIKSGTVKLPQIKMGGDLSKEKLRQIKRYSPVSPGMDRNHKRNLTILNTQLNDM